MSDENTRTQELNGIIEALHEYSLKEGTIITGHEEEATEVDGKTIRLIPARKWLPHSQATK